ncbi:Calx-beta domain-containing protein [Thiomicrorhabdus chilensis]|uniref:Calx-beta domain-containing protein n=1 Tax=Thiomicrorhabdus chilensis TaxID=63656 RepID=UPI00040BC98A|nr:Calx-beta domain-containing protein [Thiomicrorhabdus chilensis]
MSHYSFSPNQLLNLLFISFLSLFLSACGGGGGGGSDEPSPQPTTPSLSIADATAVDVATSVDVTVTLSAASDQEVTVDYASADGSANNGIDYQTTSGTLVFTPGEIVKTISVTLVEGRDTSLLKTLLINLSNPKNAELANNQAVIVLLSGNGTNIIPSLSISDATATDIATNLDVTVTLSEVSDQEVAVDYATGDGSATSAADYDTTSGTLTFAAGDTTKTISITLKDGRDTTSLKSFVVNLSSPVNATIADAQADISLLDSEHSSLFNNPTYSANWGTRGVFTNASTCASCHTGTTTVMNYDNTDISPPTQWKHSVMAHSLNDPYYNAVVEEEVHIFPDKKVFIEDTCLRCHAPMASTHAHQTLTGLVDDPTGLSPDGGYPFETAMSDPHAREGISCTACHQMQDPTITDPIKNAEENLLASMSGHYIIKSEADNNDAGIAPSIFGPFKSPIGSNMQTQTGYMPQYAAHISESAMCATCHNLYTPTLDLNGDPHLVTTAEGDKIAQFPEQTPYWDWLNSIYSDVNNPQGNKTCQACHMAQPEPGYTTPITTKPTSASARPDAAKDDADTVFSVHEFVGGNSYLLGLLKTYMEELGIADKTTETGFDEKIAQTRSMLESAASLEVTSSLAGNELTVPVTITNLTGHRLPTSFPSRRMWVHLTVTDTNSDTVIFESGAVDANGRLAKDNDITGFIQSACLEINKETGFDSLADGCYEAHHDVIDDASQVQIYEPVLGDVNGDITHVLLHANEYIKDNRIPPIGWTLDNRHANPVTPGQYDDDVTGLAAGDTNFASGKDGSGSDGKDTVTYRIDTNGFTGPFAIEVELLYQSIRPSFVYSMHADDVEHGGIDGDSHVRRFKYMYEENPPVPEVLATQNTTSP